MQNNSTFQKHATPKQKILEYLQERFRKNDKTLLREIEDQIWGPDCASTLFLWQVASAPRLT